MASREVRGVRKRKHKQTVNNDDADDDQAYQAELEKQVHGL